ncbi:DNA-protecting protein DprA [Parvularcula sp. ZS-1/3]|uniref:DNA-protecting protein DprA n=1 Tax=Parvularcula mediterranea TaxID=2732508 RepID=A0A7Y3RL32_9PROT|nr:DNA-processing protein DprA [Parvularcula mediterranea]NNU15491.1 DNA-protecting protein DprA [Parvularcula mediterranea]
MRALISDEEKLARLRLIRSRGIGPLTYGQLLARSGSALSAIELLPELAEKAGRRRIELMGAGPAAREMDAAARLGAKIVTLGEAEYPGALAAIADPPPLLTVIGNLALLLKDNIGIVGARNASAAGRRMARDLAHDLGAEGFVVASGMARGIDGAAHEAAFENGTVAVLAGGADSIYPPEHASLYRQITEKGAIVSEQPLGMTARAKDFPKRNRIVSGLSRGVVVVEAAERSGTLITARLASEQGREVFAVPGSPLDPRSGGTNDLLRRGATLIRDAQDVIDELAQPMRQGLFEPPADPYTEEGFEPDPTLRATILSLLSFTPTHRDRLIAEAGASAGQVAAVLLDLVLEGKAAEETGGAYVLSSESGGR